MVPFLYITSDERHLVINVSLNIIIIYRPDQFMLNMRHRRNNSDAPSSCLSFSSLVIWTRLWIENMRAWCMMPCSMCAICKMKLGLDSCDGITLHPLKLYKGHLLTKDSIRCSICFMKKIVCETVKLFYFTR